MICALIHNMKGPEYTQEITKYSPRNLKSYRTVSKACKQHSSMAKVSKVISGFLPFMTLHTHHLSDRKTTFLFMMNSSVGDPWLTDPDADPEGPKTYGFYGSGCGTLVHWHHFSTIKSPKEVTKQKKSRFFLLFLLYDGRIPSLIRTYHKRIRTRIRKAQNIRILRIRMRIPNTDE